jgi:hypothetical protein
LDSNAIEFEVCHAQSQTYSGLTTLWTFIICEKEDVDWHQRDCLSSDYVYYGVKSLPLCPNELQSNALFQWCSIGYEVVRHIEEGKEKKTSKVEFHETPPRKLISYLKLRLKMFILHNFLAKWQDVQFKKLLETMPEGVVISCVDFLKNNTT